MRAFTESHLREVISSQNVELCYHATACGLTIRGTPSSVHAVEAATLAGNRVVPGSVTDRLEGGVVDSDGRAHGNEILYVTGSSVFPTSGFANPTPSVVAMALRLAGHLETRL